MTNVEPQAEDSYLFIDGHAVAFHSWFTSYPNSVIPGFMSMVKAVIDEHRPSGVVVAFDPPPPTFRHDLYPSYKANRPTPPDDFLDECRNFFLRSKKRFRNFCENPNFSSIFLTMNYKNFPMGLLN